MNCWPQVTVAEVCAKPQYGAIAKGSAQPVGPPFVRQTDIVSGRITWSSVPFCDLPDSEFEKYALHSGDLLISRLGNGVGNAATVREPGGAVFAGYLVRFQTDTDVAVPEFLGYQLQSQAWRQHVAGFRSGAAQPTLNAQQMGAFRFHLPPLEEQRGVAATLGTLDDKIESNRRVIKLVPRLIRAFVDQALDGAACQIPVANLARFVNGGAYTKGASGTGRMVIRIAELNSGPGGSTVYSGIDVPDEKTARPGDLLMSWSGSLGIYRWVLNEAIINQHIFKVIPSDGYPPWLGFDRLNQVMSVFQAIAKDKATTMGHIQRGHLESTTVPVPSQPTIEALDDQLAQLWDRLLLAERENVTLTQMRDVLLPELLSGRIRVPEARETLAGTAVSV